MAEKSEALLNIVLRRPPGLNLNDSRGREVVFEQEVADALMNPERKRRYHQAADAFGALIGVCFDLPPFLLIQDAGYIIFDVGFVDVVFYHISGWMQLPGQREVIENTDDPRTPLISRMRFVSPARF